MKRIFACADSYVSSRGWKMVALLKFCLCSIGVLLGLSVPNKHKKSAGGCAMGVFLVTYFSLMADFLTFAVDFFKGKDDGSWK